MTRESEPGMEGVFAARARELSWLYWFSSSFYLPPFSGCGQVSTSLAFKVGMGLLHEGMTPYPILGTYFKLL